MKKKGLKYISVRLQYSRKTNLYYKITKLKKLDLLSLYSWFIHKQYSILFFVILFFFVFSIIFMKVVEYEKKCRTRFYLHLFFLFKHFFLYWRQCLLRHKIYSNTFSCFMSLNVELLQFFVICILIRLKATILLQLITKIISFKNTMFFEVSH